MLTLFTIPKPFENSPISIIQKNAIRSWSKLHPQCEIILFGNEKGIAEVARSCGVLHIPEIKRNEFGTPLIDDIFERAQKLAKYDILAYVNADIVLMSDFIKAVEKIKKPKFLMVGRRTDLDVKELINFEKTGWEEDLLQRIDKEGKLHGPAGIDYFIFPRGLWQKIPPFALGRTCWDNWLLYQAWSERIPLIDATRLVKIIHQNHTYSHHPQGKTGIWTGPEAKKNLKLAGGDSHLFTIRDASLVLTASGLEKPKLTIYRFFSSPFRYFSRVPPFGKIFLFPGWLLMLIWRKINKLLI